MNNNSLQLDYSNPRDFDVNRGSRSGVPARPPVRAALLTGLLLLGGGLGGFCIWADRAPLASASVSVGAVMVDGRRKVIQHLEGGTIAEILVRDGDHVEAGQVLLRLDDLEARATYDILERQYMALAAREARLQAEQMARPELPFPSILVSAAHRPEIATILRQETEIFESGRDSAQGQVGILRQRTAELAAQIAALQSQLASGDEQLAIVEEEVAAVKQLFDKGLERKPRLLTLMRTKAFLGGQQGDYRNRIAQAKESIAGIELEILNVARTRIQQAALELGRVAPERAEIEQRLAQAAVKIRRRDVVAPVAGTVMALHYFTLGGVVQPGRSILEIVPEGSDLVVESRISPTDIDVVRVGQPARLVMTALDRRVSPQVDGTVVQVSADAIDDAETRSRYYLARIGIDKEQLAGLHGVQLTPGMPVEVFIQTGTRSALDYLLKPVRQSLRRAFREE